MYRHSEQSCLFSVVVVTTFPHLNKTQFYFFFFCLARSLIFLSNANNVAGRKRQKKNTQQHHIGKFSAGILELAKTYKNENNDVCLIHRHELQRERRTKK